MRLGVGLQEQSQSPGLGGSAYQASWTALEELVRLAKARGAVSVLMMTWGYREGDSSHPDLFPTFAAMQVDPALLSLPAVHRMGARKLLKG